MDDDDDDENDAKSRLVDGVMMAIPPFDAIGLYNRKTSTDIGAQLWYQEHSCTPKQQLNLIGKTTVRVLVPVPVTIKSPTEKCSVVTPH